MIRAAAKLLPLALVGCATSPRVFHVRVVDDATDRPLAGVAAAGLSRSTDADGRLTLVGIPSEGATRVTLEKSGYAPAALLWEDGGTVRVVSPALVDTFGLTPLHSQDGLWPVAEPVPVRLVPDPDGVARRPGNGVVH